MKSELVDWAIAARPISGELYSGDHYVIKFNPEKILIAVIDGLGHGIEAYEAAKCTEEVLDKYPHESLIPLIQYCHEALKKTRGIVIALASLDFAQRTLDWIGVGNITGMIIRAEQKNNAQKETLLTRGGVVGFNLPTVLRTSTTVFNKNDILLFATDGIHTNFEEGVNYDQPTQAIVDAILSQFARETDDALVLAMRILG